MLVCYSPLCDVTWGSKLVDVSLLITLSFFSKAVVVIMLEYCPAAQSPKGGDHALLFRRGFLLGRQPCRPIWCSVRRMVWALTGWPPTPSTSVAMLAALIRLFPKHKLWIWCWARGLNFFGRQWRGLFWVEPILLNCCMVLATMLQLSFRVLAIFL